MSKFNYMDIVVLKRKFQYQGVHQIEWVSECGKWIKIEKFATKQDADLFEHATPEEIQLGHRVEQVK